MSSVTIYSFNWVDGVYAALIVFSIVLGAFRGFARSLLALLVWVLAFIIPGVFGGLLAPYFSKIVSEPNAQLFLAMGSLFIVVLIVGWIFSWIIKKSIQDSDLGGADRFLGGIFGFFRGIALLVIITSLVMLTNLAHTEAWKKSVLVDNFGVAIENILSLFPVSWTQALEMEITNKY